MRGTIDREAYSGQHHILYVYRVCATARHVYVPRLRATCNQETQKVPGSVDSASVAALGDQKSPLYAAVCTGSWNLASVHVCGVYQLRPHAAQLHLQCGRTQAGVCRCKCSFMNRQSTASLLQCEGVSVAHLPTPRWHHTELGCVCVLVTLLGSQDVCAVVSIFSRCNPGVALLVACRLGPSRL